MSLKISKITVFESRSIYNKVSINKKEVNKKLLE